MGIIALASAFALIPLILSWRWLVGYVAALVVLLIVSPFIEAAVFPAPRGEFGEAHFLSYDLLFGASAALGVIGRSIGLALKHWNAPFAAIVIAQLAPLIIAVSLLIGPSAWNDRPPSEACRAARFDVSVADVTLHLRPAALVQIDTPVGAPRGVLGYSMEARNSLNSLCDATRIGRQPLRAGAVDLDFFAFTDRPFLWHWFQQPVETDSRERIEQFCHLFAGQHWAATACADLRSNVRALPQSVAIAQGASYTCAIPLSPRRDCTYNSFQQIAAGEHSPDDPDNYWLRAIAARTDHQSLSGDYTRHDVSFDARDPTRSIMRTYFVAGPSLPRDARGRPLVLECGVFHAQTAGDMTCETTYPLTTTLFIYYSFEGPAATIAERASAIDAFVREAVVELQQTDAH